MISGSTRQMMAMTQASVLMVILFVFASGARASTTLTYRQGVNGYTGTQDTMIIAGQNGDPNTIYGAQPTFDVFEREVNLNDFAHALVRFDLSSISPSTVIGSATLTLTNASGHGTSGGGVTRGVTNLLYVINNTASPADAAWTQSSATWNNAVKSTSQPWNGGPGLVSGIDYSATTIATAVTPNGPSDSDNETMTFTLDAAGVAAINDWIQNPTGNAGFFIDQPAGTFSVDSFYSSEESTVSFRPELTLVTTPEPASLGLLLAGGVMLLRRRRV